MPLNILKRKKILKIYYLLNDYYGNLKWWPGNTSLEIIIGAILTQNTSWTNVEKSIKLLKKNKMLSYEKLRKAELSYISKLIKSSGYYNQKSKKIKDFIKFVDIYYNGSLRKLYYVDNKKLRDQLLNVKGIGPETADSILLYALKKEFFVVDAYTKRIFGRLGLINMDDDYQSIQLFFQTNLPKDISIYNQYHALIVNLGKDYCKKKKPMCIKCPLLNLNLCNV